MALAFPVGDRFFVDRQPEIAIGGALHDGLGALELNFLVEAVALPSRPQEKMKTICGRALVHLGVFAAHDIGVVLLALVENLALDRPPPTIAGAGQVVEGIAPARDARSRPFSCASFKITPDAISMVFSFPNSSMKALIKGPAIRASISRLSSTGISLISMALSPVSISLLEGCTLPLITSMGIWPVSHLRSFRDVKRTRNFCLRDRSVRRARTKAQAIISGSPFGRPGMIFRCDRV